MRRTDRIKVLRTRFNLTQIEMAKRIGVSFVTLNRWENGHNKPNRLGMMRIKELENQIKKSI